MVEIRRLHPEFLGKDGYAVRLRIPRKQVPDRFRAKDGRRRDRWERRLTDHPPPTPQPTPCRLWQGPVDKYGYGSMKQYLPNGHRRTVKAHRWVVEQIHGFLAPDQVVLHLCDNRLCFRYDHLRIGTVAENNADMKAKGRAKPPPVNRLFGKSNPNTKLDPIKRIDVFDEWLAGTPMHPLAAKYGVSSQRVHAICKVFRQDDRAWQSAFARLVHQGHDPIALCERLGLDPRQTDWGLFEPFDMRSVAPVASGATERTNPVKETQDEPDVDVPG